MNPLKYYTSDKYIAAADLDGKDVSVTVADVKVEEVQGQPGTKPKKKCVVYFTKGVKGLVLNKTNVRALAKRLGQDTEQWKGQSITLHPTTCSAFGDNNCPCIRVK